MFDIGIFEVLLIALIFLIIVGPSKLPEVMYYLGRAFLYCKRIFRNIRDEVYMAVDLDTIKQKVRNDDILSRIDDQDASSSNRIDQSKLDSVDAKTVETKSTNF